MEPPELCVDMWRRSVSLMQFVVSQRRLQVGLLQDTRRRDRRRPSCKGLAAAGNAALERLVTRMGTGMSLQMFLSIKSGGTGRTLKEPLLILHCCVIAGKRKDCALFAYGTSIGPTEYLGKSEERDKFMADDHLPLLPAEAEPDTPDMGRQALDRRGHEMHIDEERCRAEYIDLDCCVNPGQLFQISAS